VTERAVFTPGAADRIAKVVRIVEAGDRNTSYTPPPPRMESGAVFRVCRFTGAWSFNTAKTVTFFNQTATPNTVVAQNIFVTLTGSTATSTFRNCAVAKSGTAWYLIAAQC